MELNIRVPGQASSEQKVLVSDITFSKEFNESLVHQVVVAYQAAARAGTKAQKNRSAVRGGGAKPWAQKGTGRARAGTSRSPLWRSGGCTFAAAPRDFSQKVNKKMYRGAMKCILSEMIRQERLTIVEDIKLDDHKTKSLVQYLDGLSLKDNVLMVTENLDENLYLASRNIIKVDVLDVCSLNPVSIIKYDNLLITVSALKQLEESLA